MQPENSHFPDVQSHTNGSDAEFPSVFSHILCKQGTLRPQALPCISWERRGKHVLVLGKKRRTSVLVGEPFQWEEETWAFLQSENAPSLVEAGPGRYAPTFELVGVKNLLWNATSQAFLFEQARHIPIVFAAFALFLFGNFGFPSRTVLAPAFRLDKKALQVQHLAATLDAAPIKTPVSLSKSLPAIFSTVAPSATPPSTVAHVASATPQAPSKGRANPDRVHTGSPLSGSGLSRFFLPDAKAPTQRNEE